MKTLAIIAALTLAACVKQDRADVLPEGWTLVRICTYEREIVRFQDAFYLKENTHLVRLAPGVPLNDICLASRS